MMEIMPGMAHMVVAVLLTIIPTIVIFKRAGFSPLWAAMTLVPDFGFLLVFIFLAFSDWPNQRQAPEDQS